MSRAGAARDALDGTGAELTWDMIETALSAADAVMFSEANLEPLIAAVEDIVFAKTGHHVFQNGMDGSFTIEAGRLAAAISDALKAQP